MGDLRDNCGIPGILILSTFALCLCEVGAVLCRLNGGYWNIVVAAKVLSGLKELFGWVGEGGSTDRNCETSVGVELSTTVAAALTAGEILRGEGVFPTSDLA